VRQRDRFYPIPDAAPIRLPPPELLDDDTPAAARVAIDPEFVAPERRAESAIRR
jgi:hypothetical protein